MKRPVDSPLTSELLLQAYAQGIFPMEEEGELSWYRPHRRGLLPLDERFHLSRSLAKFIRQRHFEVRWNTAFEEVVMGCAERESTWISSRIQRAYTQLHCEGWAHSVECWDEQGLQGGLYGVAQCGAFFGESMFSRKPQASKVALVALVDALRARHFTLLDTQWLTPHLQTFGGFEVPAPVYQTLLSEALSVSPARLPPAP